MYIYIYIYIGFISFHYSYIYIYIFTQHGTQGQQCAQDQDHKMSPQFVKIQFVTIENAYI